MKIEVHTDTSLSETTIANLSTLVEAGLRRFAERLTRAEVHVKNLETTRSGIQPECRLETRPAGRDPVSVTNQAATLNEAVKGAAEKMSRLLDSTFGKIDAHSGPSASGLPT